MDQKTFDDFLSAHKNEIDDIKELAHKIHASVNQHYDQTLPYSVHLDSVADGVMHYGYEVCQSTEDIIPMIFGAYFHDSMEDARLTYNNVMHLASKLMSTKQAHMATEIVYALTNEKGRTRAERANDKYYQGIRSTPYAPLCKYADRLANVTYSAKNPHGHNPSMKCVYAQEYPHFAASVLGGTQAEDPRMRVPVALVKAVESALSSTT